MKVRILGKSRKGLKTFLLFPEGDKDLKIVALNNAGHVIKWFNVQRIEWDFSGEVVLFETLENVYKENFKWDYEKVVISYMSKKDLI